MKVLALVSMLLFFGQLASAAPGLSADLSVQCSSRLRFQDDKGRKHVVRGPSVLGAYTPANPIKATVDGYAIQYFVLDAGDGKNAELMSRGFSTADSTIYSQIRSSVAKGETLDLIESSDVDANIQGCHVDLLAIVCAEDALTADARLAHYGVLANVEAGTLPAGCAVGK